jgi:ABC-type ATPase involved in cell division
MDREMCGEILRWVDDLIKAGAAIVIATHQTEPFVGKVARCLTLSDGSCRFIESPLR